MSGYDYNIDIIVKMKAEGLANAALVDGALGDIVAATKLTNRELDTLREHARDSSLHLRSMSNDMRDLRTTTNLAHDELRRHSDQLDLVGVHTLRAAEETKRLADRLENGLTPSLRNVNKEADGGGGQNGIYRLIQGLIPGQQTAGNLTIAIAGLAAAFPPLTLAVVGFLAVLGAWIVGMAAFLAVITLAVGGLALLTGGILALGIAASGGLDPMANLEKAQKASASAAEAHENSLQALARAQLAYDTKPTAMNLLKLQQAHEHVADAADKQAEADKALGLAEQQAASPLTELREKVEAMGKAFGEQAIPFVNQTASALLGTLPTVQQMGTEIFNWFGPRFPEIMRLSGDALVGVQGAFKTLGKAWSELAQDFLNHPVEYQRVFGQFFDQGVQAIVGLLKNLNRLSDWFIERAPAMEKILGPVFSNLGSLVQEVGKQFGRFVDWIIEHWPQITFYLDETWRHFKEGYGAIKPLLDNFHQDMVELAPLFKFIEQNAGNLVPVLQILGFAFGSLIAFAMGMFVVGVVVVAALVGIATAVTNLVNHFKTHLPGAGREFSELGREARLLEHEVSGVSAVIDSVLKVLGTAIHNFAVEGGKEFSALGTAGRAMQHDLGVAFSAIGDAFHQLGINVQIEVHAAGAQFSALGTAARTMQSDMGTFFKNIGDAFHQLGVNIQIEVHAAGAQFSALGSAARAMQTDMGNVAAQMGRLFSAIGSAAQGMGGVVGSVFSGIGGVIHNGLRGAGDAYNRFAGFVNNALKGWITVPSIDMKGYAAGGVVPGYAPGQDTVPAMLSPGEGVLTPQTVRSLGGESAIDALNRGMGAGPGLNAVLGTWGGQCIAEGTPVATDFGPKAIEDVRIGDYVWTRVGLRPVTWSGLTRSNAEVLRIEAGERELTCTPDHPLWATSVGAAMLPPSGDSLGNASHLKGLGSPPLTQPGKQSGDKPSDITGMVQLPAVHRPSAVGANSRLDDISASNHSRERMQDVQISRGQDQPSGAFLVVEAEPTFSLKQASSPSHLEAAVGRLRHEYVVEANVAGMAPPSWPSSPQIVDDLQGLLAPTPAEPGPEVGQHSRHILEGADSPLPEWLEGLRLSAPLSSCATTDGLCEANNDITVSHDQSQSAARNRPTATSGQRYQALALEQTSCPRDLSSGQWRNAGALEVGDYVWCFDEHRLQFTAVRISGIETAAPVDVYDLTVADAHEFVANGLLVHNCVEFIQRMLGLSFRGNANTWVNAPYAHTQTAAPGEVAVFTGGPYGHVAIVTGAGDGYSFPVIDSNWVGPEIIGAHTMSRGMYGFATFLNTGASAAGLSGIPGLSIPIDLLNGLVDKALGGLGGWQGGFAKKLMTEMTTSVKHKLGFDQGGDLPPGMTMAWNGTGRTETVTPASTMDKLERLMAEAVSELRQMNGKPKLSAATAGMRF
jgi:hypothetical protein